MSQQVKFFHSLIFTFLVLNHEAEITSLDICGAMLFVVANKRSVQRVHLIHKCWDFVFNLTLQFLKEKKLIL